MVRIGTYFAIVRPRGGFLVPIWIFSSNFQSFLSGTSNRSDSLVAVLYVESASLKARALTRLRFALDRDFESQGTNSSNVYHTDGAYDHRCVRKHFSFLQGVDVGL